MRKLLLAGLLCVVPIFSQSVPTITAGASSVQEGQTVALTCQTNCTGLTWQVNGITGGNATYGTISGSGSTATYTAPSTVLAQNQDSGCPVFPNDAVWNVPVTGLPLISNWKGDPVLNDAFFINYLAAKGFSNLSVTYGIGSTQTNNSIPIVPIESNYGSYADKTIPYHGWPSLKRESSPYTNQGNTGDHHTVFINTDNCDLHDLYNDSPQPAHCTGDPAGTTNCYLASSTMKNVAVNDYSWTGGTDAASEPMDPYLIRLDEIKRGVINHAMRFDLVQGYAPNATAQSVMWPANGSTGFCGNGVVQLRIDNSGSGYSASTTATLVGGFNTPGNGGVQATVSLTISGGQITGASITNYGNAYFKPSQVTVQLNNTGGGTGAILTPIIDPPCPPYGARYFLDTAYLNAHNGPGCTAGTHCLTGAALIVATALNKYGMMMNDNTCCGIFSMYANSDINLDPTVRNQINSGSSGLGTLSIGDFHIVDDTNLAINASTNNATGCGGHACATAQVLPNNNAGIIPDGATWVTATNSSGASSVINIIRQPATIGVEAPEIYILAGDYSGSKGTGGGYQLKSWVHGSDASPAVTWTLSGTPTGTITPGGIYTPPVTETSTGLQDIAVCTLNANSAITTSVYINILPNSGNYQTGTIRIDTGNGSNFGPDGNGNYWLKDQGYETQDGINGNDGSWKYYTGTGENSVYATWTYSGGENRYRFIVPNGNYSVRLMSGWGSSPSISTTAWNHMPVMVSGTNAGQGVIEGLHWNLMQTAGFPYAIQSNSDFDFGSKVTDNVLQTDLATDQPLSDWPTCQSGCLQYKPSQSGLVIQPDASAPHWNIAVSSLPSQNGTDYLNSENVPIAATGAMRLYVQDFYTGLNDPVWSIVSGPGTLTPTTLQLNAPTSMQVETYKPPTTQPAANTGVIIKAQSQSNPSISATIRLQLAGSGTGPTSTPTFFK